MARTNHRSSFIRGAVRSRRETEWIGITAVFPSLASSGVAALTSSLSAAALALRPFTIVRTHIAWLCQSDQVAVSEPFIGNLGLAVVSDQATAVGVTAVPTPATEQGSDLWFLHAIWPGQMEFVTAAGFASYQPKEIDSKAMRKVVEGQDVVMVVEAGLGGNGVDMTIAGRMLVKLH